MKKNIAIFISIITLILLLTFLQINIKKEPNVFAGTHLKDGLYSYALNLDKDSYISGFSIIKDDVYYLESKVIKENITNYKLNKINIYTNKKTTINEIKETKSDCYLEKELINCTNEKETKLYDLNLNKVFNTTFLENEYFDLGIIPYKDNYLKIVENKIYLLKDKTHIFKSLDEKLKDYELLNYFNTKENTYLLFENSKKYYLYDINESNIKEIESSSYFKYDTGFYFINNEEIKILDLKNKEELKYPNNLEIFNLNTSILSQNKEELIWYDELTNKIYIENLKSETIIEYPLYLKTEELIENIIIQKNLLFIMTSNSNFYILNLEEINNKAISLTTFKEQEKSIVNNKIKEIKDKYNVNIKIDNNESIEYPDFSAEKMYNKNLILLALENIETILTKFSKEFFETFYNLDYQGLNIYLTGTLTPNDYETQISNPAAYSLIKNKEYMIVIDIEQPNIEELTCHELEHNLEFNLHNLNISPFDRWSELNPLEFSYQYSYTNNSNDLYTMNEKLKEDIYFIDSYSHTYPTEDRARIFEGICSANGSINKEYPNLYKKANYLKAEILKYYPSLNDTELFKIISE